MGVLRFYEEVDQNALVSLKLVFFDISYSYISIIDAGACLDGAKLFCLELDVQSRGVLRDRRVSQETIEFPSGYCRRPDPDADIIAGENCLQSPDTARRQLRTNNPEERVFNKVFNYWLLHLYQDFYPLIIEVRMEFFDEPYRNAFSYHLRFAGDDTGGILKVDCYFNTTALIA